MSNQKYKFVEMPEKGKFGKWVTEDGFTCYTDNRATAVSWYVRHLKKEQTKSLMIDFIRLY